MMVANAMPSLFPLSSILIRLLWFDYHRRRADRQTAKWWSMPVSSWLLHPFLSFPHLWHRAIYILYSHFFVQRMKRSIKNANGQTITIDRQAVAVAIQKSSCDRRQNSLWAFDVGTVINYGLISLYAYRIYAWAPYLSRSDLDSDSNRDHNDVIAWCTVC